MSGPYTALVTGGSRGIGFAIAQRLADDGFSVLAPSRAEMDLSSKASVDAYVQSLSQAVHVLVNAAGINRIAALHQITDLDMEETLQTNLIGPFRLTRAVAVRMIENGFGRIVNVSSIWTIVGKSGRASYAISKTALNGMTRSLAVELAPFNILVNAVAPGVVLTDMTRQNNTDAELQDIADAIPLRRLAKPEEIAEVTAFLCSERNTYITGQTIIVDGGYTCL